MKNLEKFMQIYSNKKPQLTVEVSVLHICHGVTSQVAIGKLLII